MSVMNLCKKIAVAFFVASELIVSSCSSGAGGGSYAPPAYKPNPEGPVTGKTAAQIIEAMGAGWNLGNTLDANNESNSNKGLATETSWGMPRTTKGDIQTVAAAGFKHVRVPVSWHNHLTGNKIDDAWLARVKEIVDWCIEYNLYVVINIHHDNYKEGAGDFWGFCVGDDTHVTQSISYVENIWQQVATYFKDYDQRLVFETLNEPRIRDGSHGGGDGFWCNTYMDNDQTGTCATCTAVAGRINTLNQKALDKIRSTGGNNASRLVIVPGTAASPDYAFRNDFKLPTDTASNLLALSVHMYTPNEFAFAPAGTSTATFTDSHKATLDHYFNTLNTKFSVPIFIGEFSATNKNNSAERVKWASCFVAGAAAKKMAYCLWDNNDFDKNTDLSERHGHLVRGQYRWNDEAFIKAITGKQDLSGGSSSGNTDPTPGTKTALGLTGFNNWGGTCTATGGTAISVTISYSGSAPEQYKNYCGASVSFGSSTQVTFTVKNNKDEEAYVKIDVKKGDDSAVTAATVNDSSVSVQYGGAETTLAAKGEATFVLTINPSVKADTFLVGLNNNKTSNPTSGSITISEAYMY